MGNRTARLWTVLRDDDGECAIVVPKHVDVTEALIEAVQQVHGELFTADNPAIVEAAKDLKVECWHSCTKAWKEAECVDSDLDGDWWAPHGDGKRSIYVVAIEQSLYVIGDEAEAWVTADA